MQAYNPIKLQVKVFSSEIGVKQRFVNNIDYAKEKRNELALPTRMGGFLMKSTGWSDYKELLMTQTSKEKTF